MENQYKHNKISVITVVYNDVFNIEKTMNSFFDQSWPEKEYIVIDGGSTDGTVDVIMKYQDRLSFFCSQKDKGIYDAMNKGIDRATGNWICFLNSGDWFANTTVLEDIFKNNFDENIGVLYGNSIEVNEVCYKKIFALDDVARLEYFPIYRHGSSFVRTEIQKANKYNLKRKDLGYALDIEMIRRLYKNGVRFKKVDTFIEVFQKEGISNHPYLNLWYNYKVTSEGRFNFKKFFLWMKVVIFTFLKRTAVYKWSRAFLIEYMVNDILPHVPFWTCRRAYLSLLKMKIGKGSFIMKDNYFINANNVVLGNHSHINRGCIIDARGKIYIGNSVSLSHKVNIMTGSHDVQSEHMLGTFEPIIIEDFAWLGVGCTVLQGITIGKGAVVCAGAVVTKDVCPFDIVAGVPARKIGTRNRNLSYECKWDTPLT